MKQTIFCSLLLILFISSAGQISAQTEKGKLLLAGESSLDFSSFNSKWQTDYGSGDNGKSRYLDIKAQIGYFIFSNFVIGLEIPYSYSKEIKESNTSITSSVTFVPFLKCYLGKSKIKPYLQGGIGLGRGNNKFDDAYSSETKVPTKISAREIGGGLGIFLNEHFSMDLGIGYAYVSSKWLDKSTNMNWKYTSKGIGASIGIVICL
jgi:opacity protein-like surface antigen